MKRQIQYIIISLSLYFTLQLSGQSNINDGKHDDQKIGGFTLVAPPNEFVKDPMIEIKALNTSWIAVVPYGFNREKDPNIKYNLPMQWWGEKKEGVVESIKLAKAAGMKVMLKPQIYIPGSWVGEMDFETESDWLKWEESYKSYINFYAKIAEDYEVDLFCVGTEYKIAVQKRTPFWITLIEDVSCIYNGSITYSCNWDSYENNPLWERLDYIGISGYFPLSEKASPSVESLKTKWKPIVKRLRQFSKAQGKQIIFTEMGYLSVDQCAHNTWELEDKIYDLPINEKAQSNAFEALYQSLWHESFWKGGFIWKWYPNKQGATGYFERDYTPQEKEAANIIKSWFLKNYN